MTKKQWNRINPKEDKSIQTYRIDLPLSGSIQWPLNRSKIARVLNFVTDCTIRLIQFQQIDPISIDLIVYNFNKKRKEKRSNIYDFLPLEKIPNQGCTTMLIPYMYKRTLNELSNTYKDILRERERKIKQRHSILPTTKGYHFLASIEDSRSKSHQLCFPSNHSSLNTKIKKEEGLLLSKPLCEVLRSKEETLESLMESQHTLSLQEATTIKG